MRHILRALLIITILFALSCAPDNTRVDVKGDSLIVSVSSPVIDSTSTTEEHTPAELSGLRAVLQNHGNDMRKYAKRYGFDWRLILSVIKQESRFTHEAESEKGAFGLMQIMPRTSAQIAKELGLEETNTARNNIAAGTYYLWQQFEFFDSSGESDRIRLALASYNCGRGRILDAQDVARYLNESPHQWPPIEDSLPLLSKQYYTLHRSVWGMDKPRNGYFSDWKQTVNYVRNVMADFQGFKLALR
jgi:membrane-bound lytic murein transglycosylase F